MKRIYVEAIVAGIFLLWGICNNAEKEETGITAFWPITVGAIIQSMGTFIVALITWINTWGVK